ncbi:MAG: hypothetical protein LBC85_01885 [Fibromonadaceae bacterium]|jgi:uncharacterized protein (TIGR02145 family)|nr:hypothetical protein [Fibromonadaceae bacterium]
MNMKHPLVFLLSCAILALFGCGGDTDDWLEYPAYSSSSVASSSSAALCDGKAYDLDAQFCYLGELYNKCGDADGNGRHEYNPGSQFCHGSKVVDKCGTRTEVFDPDLYECDGNIIRLEGGFIDVRDSRNYEAVLIGTQTWMAENLNFNATGSRCYGDDTGGDDQNRCDTYGRLYNWNAAMNNAASSSATPSGIQGVCPPGWHLPSDAEWTALTNHAGSNAGTKLKANSSLWISNTGTDEFGFSAFPGGYGSSSGLFLNVGDGGLWWSATEYDASYAWLRYMDDYSSGVLGGNFYKEYLFSVRCLRE